MYSVFDLATDLTIVSRELVEIPQNSWGVLPTCMFICNMQRLFATTQYKNHIRAKKKSVEIQTMHIACISLLIIIAHKKGPSTLDESPIFFINSSFRRRDRANQSRSMAVMDDVGAHWSENRSPEWSKSTRSHYDQICVMLFSTLAYWVSWSIRVFRKDKNFVFDL